ncbi:MAG: YfiR family protein [Bacteroidetes bacterium]|nr:YfiR family protein [Bacteroidota bacterium]
MTIHRYTLIFLFIVCGCLESYTQTAEYEMKAVAFEKISRFIEWPPDAFEKTNNEFIITVLGKNPFGKILDEIYASHQIKNKNVRIKYISNIQDLDECHLLFIARSEKSEIKKIVARVKYKPILTVSDEEGDAKEGCFIDFFEDDGRLHFDINPKAMKASHFSFDYKLLQVARIVN